MRRVLKWLGIGLVTVAGVFLIAAIYVWVVGGRIFHEVYDLPESGFVADPATADIEEGRRAALLRGCTSSCHGEVLEGGVFFDSLLMGRVVAPDLTRAFRDMSDQELERAIRHGIRRDGRSAMIMPSSMLHHLTDTDLNNISAFIRSEELSDGPDTAMEPGLLVRFMVLYFGFEPHAQRIRDDAPWLTADDPPGKYLAITICTECHGMDLKGDEPDTPSLSLVVAYSLENFTRLMREGIPIGDRELELMKDVAIGRFSHFTDAEIEALHAYLVTLANETLPAD